MKIWDDIVTTALLGTERAPVKSIDTAGVDGVLADALGAVGGLVERSHPGALAGRDGVSGLLDAAAVLSQYRKTGVKAAVSTVVLPEAAPVDVLPVCSDAAAALIASLLGNREGNIDILGEAIDRLGRAGLRLPHELLPEILAWGARMKRADHGPLIAAVIDQRGLWLARLNPDWKYAVYAADTSSIDASTWTGMSGLARSRLIGSTGKRDREEAHRLVSLTWDTDTAQERAMAIGGMRDWVTGKDEVFLEGLLDAGIDHHARWQTADNLKRLPDSAFVGRMIERAERFVKVSYKFDKGHVLEVTLPELDESMKRDGVDRGMISTETAVGIRAGYVAQIVESIPPSYWSARFEVSPEQFVDLIVKSDFAQPLLQALAEAVSNHPDDDRAFAMLAYMTRNRRSDFPIDEMMRAVKRMSSERYADLILPLLGRAPLGAPGGLEVLLAVDIGKCPDVVGRALLAKIEQTLNDFGDHQTLTRVAQLLQQAAKRVSPELLPEMSGVVDRAEAVVDGGYHRQFMQAVELLSLRAELHWAIPEAPPPDPR